MALFDAKTLFIEDCTVVWDGITSPETSEGNGKLRYSLKVVVHPNNPDIGLLHQLANDCLLASEFKGVLPNGGLMPVGTAGPAEFGGMFPGFAVVNASTYLQPRVYDENGKELQPMQYGPMMYTGQKVRLLVTCFAYNNKSKGVKASLEGFQIIASAQAPRLQIGGGGGAAAKAFGAPQGQGGYGQQQQGQGQGGYGQQQQGQGQGGYGQQQQGQGQGGYGQQQQGQDYPAQAHNFLPQ